MEHKKMLNLFRMQIEYKSKEWGICTPICFDITNTGLYTFVSYPSVQGGKFGAQMSIQTSEISLKSLKIWMNKVI